MILPESERARAVQKARELIEQPGSELVAVGADGIVVRGEWDGQQVEISITREFCCVEFEPRAERKIQ